MKGGARQGKKASGGYAQGGDSGRGQGRDEGRGDSGWAPSLQGSQSRWDGGAQGSWRDPVGTAGGAYANNGSANAWGGSKEQQPPQRTRPDPFAGARPREEPRPNPYGAARPRDEPQQNGSRPNPYGAARPREEPQRGGSRPDPFGGARPREERQEEFRGAANGHGGDRGGASWRDGGSWRDGADWHGGGATYPSGQNGSRENGSTRKGDKSGRDKGGYEKSGREKGGREKDADRERGGKSGAGWETSENGSKKAKGYSGGGENGAKKADGKGGAENGGRKGDGKGGGESGIKKADGKGSADNKAKKGDGKGGDESGAKKADGKGGVKKASGSLGTGAVTSKHLSSDKFSALPVSSETKTALAQGFGYELMTQVQAATVHPLLRGEDVLARAKTGTGKTLAFLVPIIERIRGRPGGKGGPISALILSPTRELAQQIYEEARTILRYHNKLGAACFYGGTNIKSDKAVLDRDSCDILVATPGRMQDHLDNTPGFKNRLQNLSFLTLDEADQLLDMGFRDSILAILRLLPDSKTRQGALFSATFPNAVGEIAKLALKKSYTMIDTVHPDDEVTPDQIEQCTVITDLDNMMETLYWAVSHEMKSFPGSYKIMVFFVTARLTQFFAEQFCHAGVDVLEIHSRKSQAHRTKCAEKFRSGQCGIVFSSDVLARGLDMPDVTAVIQVGVPSSRDQYIHRLGRTGRAGKSGRCTLLLHDFEQYFLKGVKDLPVKNLTAEQAFPKAGDAPNKLWDAPSWKTGGQAYQAFLGYYNSAKGLSMKKDDLVAKATHFASTISMVGDDGLPPAILKKTVGKMGLKGVSGLNVVSVLPYDED